MNPRRTRLHILHEPKSLAKNAKTGVSLHCHTEHSKEMLDFVPYYAAKLPVIRHLWRMEKKRFEKREGKPIDFSSGYWNPPLDAFEVFAIEQKQIHDAGLEAIVSLTDHDCIEANLRVNESRKIESPVSLEWTVPFEFGFFHVGVHNLPRSKATAITEVLLEYTFKTRYPTNGRLHELFRMLNAMHEVLIVLNHPLWDIELIGKERHEILLRYFLEEHGRWIHALEFNGFRSWSENRAVVALGESYDIPVVTGGDRHGCKPNTVINLSGANTFEEFVEEIRIARRSEIALMPEYSQPLHSRQLQSFAEILGHYPGFSESKQQWIDRIYFDVEDGQGLRPLSSHWRRGGPSWLRWAVWTLGIFGSTKIRPAFRLTMHPRDVVPKQSVYVHSTERFVSGSASTDNSSLITHN